MNTTPPPAPTPIQLGEHKLANGRRYKLVDDGPYQAGEYPSGGIIIMGWDPRVHKANDGTSDWVFIDRSPNLGCAADFLRAASRLVPLPFADPDIPVGLPPRLRERIHRLQGRCHQIGLKGKELWIGPEVTTLLANYCGHVPINIQGLAVYQMAEPGMRIGHTIGEEAP